MSKLTIFSSTDRFSIEVESLDKTRDYGNIFIRICGEIVGDGYQVCVPTFTAEIGAFAQRQNNPTFSVRDFGGVSDDEAFNLLNEIVLNGSIPDVISEHEVWGYHFMHSLDNVVDGWRIFVVDDGPMKRIIWKGTGEISPPQHHRNRIWSTKLSASELVDTILRFVDFVETKIE